jgi:diadenosine tetraphosphate (Ap4A) HIT family hydrolase/DNA-binding XRE family transcriptional regulator
VLIPLINGGIDWSTVLNKIFVKKDTETAKIVGQRIRELRRQRALTQEKLSDLSGVDSKHIQLMEGANPSNPRVDTILSICKALDIRLSDFFSDSMEEKLGTVSIKLAREYEPANKVSSRSKTLTFKSNSDLKQWEGITGNVAAGISGTAEQKKIKNNLQAFLNLTLGREIILEDQWVFCLYDSNPLSRGHLNLLFKRLYKSYFDSLPEEKRSLWDMMEKAKSFLDREYAASGYTVGFNLGKAAGQTEDYFILDIIPKYSDEAPAEKTPRASVPVKRRKSAT